MVVKLEVGYGTGEMVLEVVRKWEHSQNNGDFQYWATISEFSLKLDGEIVKDSENQEIKGYIIEPAGEYEVFWKKSDISKPALMVENPKNTNTTIIGKSRDGILIHYGDTGEWSTGCLLPTNELRWKKERWIAKDRDSTINAIARLYIAIIKHDSEALNIMHLVQIILQKAQSKNLLLKSQSTIRSNLIRHLRRNNAFNNICILYCL
ncbi:hypothetical protein [uncultured Helicobacter sp.]|uniref:hypothetical protein n=1 Tax=uncultured Helicobacter sp. TaxID=175537 RepID=UPI00374F3E25